MTSLLMVGMAIFIIAIQAAIPYLIKPTIVFGVTIPDTYTKNHTLLSYKKIYSLMTAGLGVLIITAFLIWIPVSNASEENIVLFGVAAQFALLFSSMILYFLFHAKTSRLKRDNNWGANLKQIRVTDLAARTADEMLPWYIYIVPMIITIGLMAYIAIQFENLPDLIPTHWGIDGQPDAFSEKTVLSVMALPLMILIMQGMMLVINEMTKRSGIKINATNRKRSRAQQLSFRKYSSWFLFAITTLQTILFAFLQLSTIHTDIGKPSLLFALPIGFLIVTFIMTGIYAFKVGQGGSRLEVDVVDEDKLEGITNYDDDEHWKAGIFYVNKNDPSIFVEKRFGVGWSINFGNPIGYFIIFLPIILILAISFLL
ncbi:DUF1648 domain-containing protein [Sporosarcina sp. Marseille-Q4063]|uniref:DUF1648 domain-containing protein n=1 Tax=Sporosarcina sp. Marseille-Q4063 TaxID=2810514 RepID=UPI001BAF84FF|nr:DUF5808 domain-containing protein [Sporosarcina sp. Marseille-Q4063]QUW22654.1 DUF1648 domain-containing protein [Sporosarcina sp. Marseille-Q4063]